MYPLKLSTLLLLTSASLVACNNSQPSRKAAQPTVVPASAMAAPTAFDQAFAVTSGLKDRNGRHLLGGAQATDVAKEIVARDLDPLRVQAIFEELNALKNPKGRYVLDNHDINAEVLRETLYLAGTNVDLAALKEKLEYLQSFTNSQGQRLLDDKTAYVMARDLTEKDKTLKEYMDMTNVFSNIRATPASRRPLLTKREALKVAYSALLNPRFSMDEFEVELRKVSGTKGFQQAKRVDQRASLRSTLRKMDITY